MLDLFCEVRRVRQVQKATDKAQKATGKIQKATGMVQKAMGKYRRQQETDLGPS